MLPEKTVGLSKHHAHNGIKSTVFSASYKEREQMICINIDLVTSIPIYI